MEDHNEIENQEFLDRELPDSDAVLVTLPNVALFIEECIVYVLRWHNLEWVPLVNMDELRGISEFDLFTDEIGRALVHPVMVLNSLEVADVVHFSVDAWLQMTVDEAEIYVMDCFLYYGFYLPVDNPFRQLLQPSFACYLCRRAVIHNRGILIAHVLEQLLYLMYGLHSSSRYYDNLNTMAASFNHFYALQYYPFGDEGFLSDFSDISDRSTPSDPSANSDASD